jgi:hypothetical protein
VVTLVGDIAPHVRPDGTVSVNETVPVKPFTAATVIVEAAETPELTAAGEVAVTVKSVTVKVAVVEWESVPFAPIIVREYVPSVVELHDTVAVPEVVTLVGLMAPQVNPEGTVSVNETFPVNPLTSAMVIVDVAEVPTITAAGDVAAIVKSVMVKVAVAGWVREPLVPVMVRV